MSSAFLAIGLDIIVLCFLGATIFFVLRLYKSLNEFKAQRKQFDSIIANLLSAIDQAERSINTLKQTSAQEAGDLEKLIMKSQALSEELQIINDAGESMAKRLEKLAETNRKIVQPTSQPYRTKKDKIRENEARQEELRQEERISSPVYPAPQRPAPQREAPQPEPLPTESYQSTLKQVERSRPPKQPIVKEDLPSFMIQDRERENPAQESIEDDDMADTLNSQAERELFEALRSSKRNITGEDQS